MTQKSLLGALGIVAASLLLLGLFLFTKNGQGPAPVAISDEEPWNDIEESAVQGSRVLDDVSTPSSDENSQDVAPAYSQNASLAIKNNRDAATLDSIRNESRDGGFSDPEQESNDDSESDAPRLSQQVLDVITEVQTRQLDDQWEEALNEMNALYAAFDELNTFEQATLLNFYTNTLLQLEMWQESISAFTLMITIPDLRPDVSARALMALGQLHSQVGETDSAISYYENFLEFTDGMENMEDRTQRVRQLLNDARNEVVN